MNTPSLVAESGYVDRDYKDLFLPDRLWQMTFESKRVFTPFIARVLACAEARAALSEMATGTSASMKNLAQEDMLSLLIPLPPVREQRAIAGFLDRETARLDALVAAKERVLGLLAEKRRALITRAVTRGLPAAAAAKAGLDPQPPLRESGIPWLGGTPAHWEPKRLRFACIAIRTGGTPSPAYVDFVGEKTVDWFTPSDFGDALELRDSGRSISEDAVKKDEAPLFPGGSVFVVGIGATLGKVGFVNAPASANQQVNALVPKHDTDPAFLALALSLLAGLMTAWANTATLPILNQQRMGDLPVVLPPIAEQRKIVGHVATETFKLEALRATTERTIALLKERRAALIAAAVTGQIDVGSGRYYTDAAAGQSEPERRL